MSLSSVTEFNSLNAAYSRDVLHASRASELALFLYDVSGQGQPIRFLHNTGIAPALVNAYRQRVFRDDPLLPQLGSAENLPGAHKFGMPHLPAKQLAAAANFYSDALMGAGYIETAALSRPLSKRFYLVAGMLLGRGARQSRHIFSENAVEKTHNWLAESADHLIDCGILAATQVVVVDRVDDPLASISMRHQMTLTPREKEVVAAILKGYSNKQISACLDLSGYTIENHLRRIYKKFSVHSRTALIAALNH